jgi:hypothetical protein
VSNLLSLSSIKSLSSYWSYKRLQFKVKELSNINGISRINKSKAIGSKVNKSSKGYSISIL